MFGHRGIGERLAGRTASSALKRRTRWRGWY
jgi:hypothetical protein